MKIFQFDRGEQVKEDANRKLHSAEHIFARALTNAGAKANVRKVDTEHMDGKGELVLRDVVALEKLFEAEKEVNKRLFEGGAVVETVAPTLDEAKRRFPALRFNEERLSQKEGAIRVIQIGHFDFAACAKDHVKDISEIGGFSIIEVTYPGGETKIQFAIGLDAVNISNGIKDSVLKIAIANNFAPQSLEERYSALQRKLVVAHKKEGSLFLSLAQKTGGGLLTLEDMDMGGIYDKARQYIDENPSMYLLILNGIQLLGLKGNSCSFDLQRFGKEAGECGLFVGETKQLSMAGRVQDKEKFTAFFRKFSEA